MVLCGLRSRWRQQRASLADAPNVTVVPVEINDGWARDWGPSVRPPCMPDSACAGVPGLAGKAVSDGGMLVGSGLEHLSCFKCISLPCRVLPTRCRQHGTCPCMQVHCAADRISACPQVCQPACARRLNDCSARQCIVLDDKKAGTPQGGRHALGLQLVRRRAEEGDGHRAAGMRFPLPLGWSNHVAMLRYHGVPA